jgi:hypothetical protein|tara:strand:- start:122 stop:367 length:246 start_codon:yes stop_codon:yes gene_type:complete
MTEEEMEAMVEKAASAAAAKALHDLGLSDKNANPDLRELRSVLDAWRMAKRTAGRAVVQTLTYLFLGALLAGSYLKITGKS